MVTSTELTAAQPIAPAVRIFPESPAETVKLATEMANALAPIIEKQKMFAKIGGGKHVTIEGWLTLGAMLGITPRELSNIELPDGSYQAEIELLSRSGSRVGGASAICGIEETRWSKAERHARRSMASTRATVRAFRLAFAWIIKLAGYEVTPAEEMPYDIQVAPKPQGYDPANKVHAAKLEAALAERGVPKDLFVTVADAMSGKGFTEIDAVLEGLRTLSEP